MSVPATKRAIRVLWNLFRIMEKATIMKTQRAVRMRQVVDWSAAVWAGIIAGSAFLLLNLLLTPLFIGGNTWVMVRLFGSLLLGDDILAPPSTFDRGALIAAIVTNFALSIAFALILAIIIHRWGFITGVTVGALFGLALYGINFYSLTYFFPWFFAMRSSVFLATHIIFGALAGGIYEGLEVEEFVPVTDN